MYMALSFGASCTYSNRPGLISRMLVSFTPTRSEITRCTGQGCGGEGRRRVKNTRFLQNELLNKTPGSSPNGMVRGVARYSNTETWVGRPISTYQSRYWNTELLQHLRQFLLPRPQKAPVVMLLNSSSGRWSVVDRCWTEIERNELNKTGRKASGALGAPMSSSAASSSSTSPWPRPPRLKESVFPPNELNKTGRKESRTLGARSRIPQNELDTQRSREPSLGAELPSASHSPSAVK